MEFPETGKQCSHPDCKQLDFLPVTCGLCDQTFCKDHSVPFNHNCSKITDNVISTNPDHTESFNCSEDGCKERSTVEMICAKCSKHFCLSHRHHTSCHENKESVLPWRIPKIQFAKAKAETDKQVDEKLKAAQKNTASRATANKIRLMKLKGKAVGDNKIPVADRVFFTVHPPSGNSRQLFVSKNWTVGRSLDFFAKKLNTENNNAKPGCPKLKVFCKEERLALDTNATMGTLIEKNVICDGEPLVIEYVTAETVCTNEDGNELLVNIDKYNK